MLWPIYSDFILNVLSPILPNVVVHFLHVMNDLYMYRIIILSLTDSVCDYRFIQEIPRTLRPGSSLFLLPADHLCCEYRIGKFQCRYHQLDKLKKIENWALQLCHQWQQDNNDNNNNNKMAGIELKTLQVRRKRN